jgi:hypothetical protein
LDKIARQTHDLSIFTDGERRYGNLLTFPIFVFGKYLCTFPADTP